MSDGAFHRHQHLGWHGRLRERRGTLARRGCADRDVKVLITGAAGKIGSVLTRGLADRHELRGLDRVPVDLEDAVLGDVSDFDTMLHATRGMEAVIHLTGTDRDWEGVLRNNIGGTYNALEAARRNGVRRFVYASRAGVHGTLPKVPGTVVRTVDMVPRPVGLYSASKVVGEALGHSFSVEHGVEFVAIRIGNFNADRPIPKHPHHLGHEDAVRVFERALLQPAVRFEVVYGVSVGNWPLYDLEHGRKAIGYEPLTRSNHSPDGP